jgi:hypothetical protein
VNILAFSVKTLSTSKKIEEHLKGAVIFPLCEEEYGQVIRGEAADLNELYNF